MGKMILIWLAATAATLLLQVGVGFLGPAGFLLTVFTPLPIALLVMQSGVSVGTAAVAFTAVTLFLTGGAPGALGYLLQFGIGSVALPALFLKGLAWDKALGIVLLGLVGVAGITLAGFGITQGVSVPQMIDTHIRGEVQEGMSLYQQAGVPPEQLQEFEVIAEEFSQFLVQAWPGLAITFTGGVLLLITYFVSTRSGAKFQVPGLPFGQWKAPEHLIWFLILGGAGIAFTEGLTQRIALNLLTVVLPIYFLQGLSILTWFFRKKNVSPFFRRFGYLLVLIFNPLPLIVTGIGIFELWIDFRKPRLNKEG